MTNKYTGEVSLETRNKTLTVAYDWSAIAALRSEYTDEEIDSVFNNPDIKTIAKVLLIGLKKHHPDMTIDAVYESSPPFVPTINAIKEAFTYAYFGNELPIEAEDIEPKKKTKK